MYPRQFAGVVIPDVYDDEESVVVARSPFEQVYLPQYGDDGIVSGDEGFGVVQARALKAKLTRGRAGRRRLRVGAQPYTYIVGGSELYPGFGIAPLAVYGTAAGAAKTLGIKFTKSPRYGGGDGPLFNTVNGFARRVASGDLGVIAKLDQLRKTDADKRQWQLFWATDMLRQPLTAAQLRDIVARDPGVAALNLRPTGPGSYVAVSPDAHGIAPSALPSPMILPPVMKPPPMTQPGVAPLAGRYTVKAGDTLSKIARDVLGNINRWPDIAKLNNIPSPYTIRVGQVLRLPETSVEAAPGLPAPAPGPVTDIIGAPAPYFPQVPSPVPSGGPPTPTEQIVSEIEEGGVEVPQRAGLLAFDTKSLVPLALIGVGALILSNVAGGGGGRKRRRR